jgi:hypothetical protein
MSQLGQSLRLRDWARYEGCARSRRLPRCGKGLDPGRERLHCHSPPLEREREREREREGVETCLSAALF